MQVPDAVGVGGVQLVGEAGVLGGDDTVARWLLLVDADIDVIHPPELAQAFGRLARRCARAAAPVYEGER
ncbi:hypothetical protein FCI23_49245 [Actinacidiphila oryziradicis]|uniref:WYL domain-containing protein n=1 Tax=Actinacidiphila oryziradicis TaxID=2571141 RepID=A0A4U0RR40_9ACTN|nr:hypothetical protein FCI23_49245 [Actinacidiphila oryziradicis]